MNVQDFMTSMLLKDGFGSGMPGGGQLKGKNADKSFQDMMERMGMWMMMAPGMPQQNGQDQGEMVPDGLGLPLETNAALELDLLNAGGQMPENWNPYLQDGAADHSVFLDRMALMSRQNGVVTGDADIRGIAGDALKTQAISTEETAGIDISGWQLSEEGADIQEDAVLTKESMMPQTAVTESADDGSQALSLKNAGSSGQAEDQAAGKSGKDTNAEALTSSLADTAMRQGPKLQTAETHAKAPVYHHHVEQEQNLGKDLSKLISGQIREGQKEFEIQLEPQNLGKITIKVSNHDNQTTIAMLCSEERTLSLLAQNAKELGVIMENNLGAPAQILVDKQAPDYLNQENSQKENQQKERQKEKQSEKKHSGDEDFIQKLRLGMMSVS